MNLALPTGPLAQAIGWALLHLLWQGALVAALLAAALTVLAGRSANLRYAFSCAALALIVALGVVTAFRAYPTAHPASGITSGTWSSRGPIPIAVSSPAPLPIDRLGSLVRAANDALPVIVTLWLAGVALCSLRLILEWLRARRLVMRGASRARDSWQSAARRLAVALGVRRAVRVLESSAVEVPSVIGLLRPAILLPASTLTGLTPAQLEMILAHELAHIRRHDFLVNLLQAVVETLLFYHPAVWWISRRVRVERENCCDDLAIAVCGNPVQYARALTRLEELRAHALPLAASATGGSLLERIRRIAGGSHRATGPAVRGAAALAVLTCVLIALATPTFPAIGEWQPRMRHRHLELRQQQRERRAQAEQTQQQARDARRAHDEARVAIDAATPSTSPASVEDDPQPSNDGVSDPDDTSSPEPDADTPPVPDVPPAADVAPAPGVPTVPEASRRPRLTIDELIQLRNQDVTPETIREVRALFPNLDVHEIAQMSAVGATPAFVRELRSAGLRVRTAPEAEGLAALGVTPAAVRGWREVGLAVESAREAQSLAAVGVTPEFINDMRAAGLAVESAEDAQGLAAVGVTAEFVRELRASGLAVESAREAQGLAAVGVSAELIRGLRRERIAVWSAEDAQGLAAVGVTPEYIRGLRDAGVEIGDASDAQRLRALGVTPQFVRRMADAGYPHLTVEQLSRLAASGMTGDFVREMSKYRSR